MDWWHSMPMQGSMRSYWATDTSACHRKRWLCSMVKSIARNKWKWSTSLLLSGYLRAHVQLVYQLILMMRWHLWFPHYCRCACLIFVAAFGLCSKCMSRKWWLRCMEVENRLKTGTSLWICHLFWVLYRRMFFRQGQACPKHWTGVAPSLKMPKTTPKITEERWCAFDKCECTGDDELLECIWKHRERFNSMANSKTASIEKKRTKKYLFNVIPTILSRLTATFE